MRVASICSSFASIALFACARPAPPTGPGGPTAAGDVVAAIASVTLADDCPDNRGPAWSLPPPVAPSEAAAAPPAADQASTTEVPAGASASSERRAASMVQGKAACRQSFVQLHLHGPAAGAPTRVAITKVELLDADGTLLGELTARAPTAWQGDHYEPWAETIAPGQELATAYELTAPAWATYGQGPFESHDGVYTLRLTIAVGDDQRTLTQQTVVSGPAVLPPGAVT